ncbi:MAG: hypothetical protein OHK0039_01630 [Bacteroidia bacterium]
MIYFLSNHRRSVIVGWMLCLCCPCLWGQQDLSHERLLPQAPLPPDFYLNLSQRLLQHGLEVEPGTGLPNTPEAQFLVQSQYYAVQLIRSGQILCNDPVSDYLASVGDRLLADHGALRARIRFYAVRSTSINAFSTADGMILVNLGLLARLDNEAQLAFVIAHEISHYALDHAWQVFQEVHRSKHRREQWEQDKGQPDLLNRYAQEKEIEADSLGLQLFLAAGYDPASVPEILDLLDSEEKSDDRTAIGPELFGHYIPELDWQDYALPEVKRPEQAAPLPSYGRTHPLPRYRKERIMSMLGQADRQEGAQWQENRVVFQEVQRICRYESCFIYLETQAYEQAIYSAGDLLRQFPGDVFLQKVIGQGVYALAKYSNGGRFWDVHRDYGSVWGSERSLAYFFEQLDEQERTLLALMVAWEVYQQSPADEELLRICEDLLWETGRYYPALLDLPAGLAADTTWSSLGLARLTQDTAFHRLLETQETRADLHLLKQMWEPRFGGGDDKKRVEAELRGFRLGLDSIVLVDPYYQRLDDRISPTRVLYLSSDDRERHLRDAWQAYTARLGVHCQILSGHDMGADSLALFMELVLLQQWIDEQKHYRELRMVSLYHSRVQALVAKFQTPYFVWNGCLAYTHRRSGKPLMLATGVLLPPLLPYAVYYAVSPRYDTLFYTYVYDLQTGQQLLIYPRLVKLRDTEDVLQSVVYDLVQQIGDR